MQLKLNSKVFDTEIKIKQSGERGIITGFAMNKRDRKKLFLVEYVAGNGNFTQGWFFEDQLSEI